MNSYQFFLKHAGYSYDPATQSPMQGRIKNARALAAAERKARDAGVSYQWEPDSTTLEGLQALGFDLSERSGKYIRVRCSQCESAVINGIPAHENGCRNRYRPQSYALWVCCAYGPPEDNESELRYQDTRPPVLASLAGIDFGRDGEPWGAPYRRVVEAELALEALEQMEV